MLACQRCHGLDGSVGGVVVEHLGAGDLNIVAGGANVVNGGNRKGVGEGSGAAVGCPAHAVSVGGAIRSVLEPAAGVTGGHRNDQAAFGDTLEDCLIGSLRVVGEAGVAAAERQIGGIGAEDDGVFNCSHVVGVVSTAALTEDLHGEYLGIRGYTLGQNGIQSIGVSTVIIGDVTVAGGNAGNMGAMVAFGIIVMGDIGVAINVVICEGDLGIDVKVFRSHAVLGDVQLGENLCGVGSSHRNGVGASDRVAVSIGVEGRMIRVSASIDDGNLGAGAGVTGSPGCGRADHLIGGRHVRVRRLRLIDDARLIAGLDENFFNAGNLFDRFDLAILHICGDDVRSKRQVPNNVESLAVQSFLGDGLGHLLLLGFQVITILDCLGICAGNLLRREALFQGRGIRQNDGDTDNIRICVLLSFVVRHCVALDRQLNVVRVVVHLFPGDVALARSSFVDRPRRGDQANRKNERKKQRNNLFPGMGVFHKRTLSFSGD